MKELSQTVTQQGYKADEIMDSLSDIKKSTGNVKNSAEEISEKTRQVEENCKSLSSMQSEVDTGLQACGNASKALSTNSKNMNIISDQAQNSVGILTKAVSKFKVLN